MNYYASNKNIKLPGIYGNIEENLKIGKPVTQDYVKNNGIFIFTIDYENHSFQLFKEDSHGLL